MKAAALGLALARGRFLWKMDGENFSGSGIQVKENHRLYKVQDELRDFKLLSGDRA